MYTNLHTVAHIYIDATQMPVLERVHTRILILKSSQGDRVIGALLDT